MTKDLNLCVLPPHYGVLAPITRYPAGISIHIASGSPRTRFVTVECYFP